MASNSVTITDPDYDQTSDWIEIYNGGTEAVDLQGYFLTDNLNTPDKWQISTSVIIEADSFILFWADGDSSGVHTNFKLSADGEEVGLFTSTLELIDSVIYGIQQVDVSYGKTTDGGEILGFFLEPTPGTSNTTDVFTDFVMHKPTLSTVGGLFQSPISVSIKNTQGGIVRYTTDGSEPTDLSPEYSSVFQLDTTTILRARVFQGNLAPGPITTHSYFFNDGFETRGLPVISIATDPANFWDDSIGIYVQDFKPDWEVPINIELFENIMIILNLV